MIPSVEMQLGLVVSLLGNAGWAAAEMRPRRPGLTPFIRLLQSVA